MLAPLFNIIRKFFLVELAGIVYIIYTLLSNSNLNPGEVSVFLVYENIAYMYASVIAIVLVTLYQLFRDSIKRNNQGLKLGLKNLFDILATALAYGLGVLIIIWLANELTTGFFASYICGEGKECAFQIFQVLDKGLIFEESVQNGLKEIYGDTLNKAFNLMFYIFVLAMTFDFFMLRRHKSVSKIMTQNLMLIAAIRTIAAPVFALIACIIWVILDEVGVSSWTAFFIMLLIFRLGIYLSVIIGGLLSQDIAIESEKEDKKRAY